MNAGAQPMNPAGTRGIRDVMAVLGRPGQRRYSNGRRISDAGLLAFYTVALGAVNSSPRLRRGTLALHSSASSGGGDGQLRLADLDVPGQASLVADPLLSTGTSFSPGRSELAFTG